MLQIDTADSVPIWKQIEEEVRRFIAMGEDSLDPYQKVDRALVLSELRGEHALQPFERWRRQPPRRPAARSQPRSRARTPQRRSRWTWRSWGCARAATCRSAIGAQTLESR